MYVCMNECMYVCMYIHLSGRNPIDVVWGSHRPGKPTHSIRMHDITFAGKPSMDKISAVREKMKEKGAGTFIHTYMHTYIHTVYTYVLTNIYCMYTLHSFIHTYIHTCIHAC